MPFDPTFLIFGFEREKKRNFFVKISLNFEKTIAKSLKIYYHIIV